MGLAEIFIPSYGFNIKPPLMSSVVIYTKGTSNSWSPRQRRHLRIRIPEGRYKPKDYVRTFNTLNDERRNRVYKQNLLGMVKLINLFTVGKKWWRKTVSRQLIPFQSISSFP